MLKILRIFSYYRKFRRQEKKQVVFKKSCLGKEFGRYNKVLVVETTKCGYDGITNVIKNYFLYQEDPEIQMDLVTINEAVPELKTFLEQKGRRNLSIALPESKSAEICDEAAKILKEGGYQIIHVHGCSGTMAVEMLAAKLAGIKVRAAHAHSTACTHTTSDKILRPFFLKWCNCRYACSDAAGKWLYKGMPFSLISNGIDLEKFQYDPVVRERLRNEYDLEDKLVIGHVGRFCEEKNHKKILEIAKELQKRHQKIKLVFVGDGPLKQETEEKAREDKLDVLFVGLSDVVEQWLQAMDVFVFPSLFEGLPLGLVEAQAAGLPCILSDRIASMTKIIDEVQFLKLEASDQVWADAVLKEAAENDRIKNQEKIKRRLRTGILI